MRRKPLLKFLLLQLLIAANLQLITCQSETKSCDDYVKCRQKLLETHFECASDARQTVQTICKIKDLYRNHKATAYRVEQSFAECTARQSAIVDLNQLVLDDEAQTDRVQCHAMDELSFEDGSSCWSRLVRRTQQCFALSRCCSVANRCSHQVDQDVISEQFELEKSTMRVMLDECVIDMDAVIRDPLAARDEAKIASDVRQSAKEILKSVVPFRIVAALPQSVIEEENKKLRKVKRLKLKRKKIEIPSAARGADLHKNFAASIKTPLRININPQPGLSKAKTVASTIDGESKPRKKHHRHRKHNEVTRASSKFYKTYDRYSSNFIPQMLLVKQNEGTFLGYAQPFAKPITTTTTTTSSPEDIYDDLLEVHQYHGFTRKQKVKKVKKPLRPVRIQKQWEEPRGKINVDESRNEDWKRRIVRIAYQEGIHEARNDPEDAGSYWKGQKIPFRTKQRERGERTTNNPVMTEKISEETLLRQKESSEERTTTLPVTKKISEEPTQEPIQMLREKTSALKSSEERTTTFPVTKKISEETLLGQKTIPMPQESTSSDEPRLLTKPKKRKKTHREAKKLAKSRKTRLPLDESTTIANLEQVETTTEPSTTSSPKRRKKVHTSVEQDFKTFSKNKIASIEESTTTELPTTSEASFKTAPPSTRRLPTSRVTFLPPRSSTPNDPLVDYVTHEPDEFEFSEPSADYIDISAIDIPSPAAFPKVEYINNMTAEEAIGVPPSAHLFAADLTPKSELANNQLWPIEIKQRRMHGAVIQKRIKPIMLPEAVAEQEQEGSKSCAPLQQCLDKQVEMSRRCERKSTKPVDHCARHLIPLRRLIDEAKLNKLKFVAECIENSDDAQMKCSEEEPMAANKVDCDNLGDWNEYCRRIEECCTAGKTCRRTADEHAVGVRLQLLEKTFQLRANDCPSRMVVA